MDIRLQKQLALSNKYFELILFITEQCNFRCKYCYEDFKVGRMRPEVIEGIKNFLKNKIKNLDFLKISWFGGEPLIVKHLVYDLSDYIKNLSDHNKVVYKANMTTNGYLLTNQVMDSLNNFNINSFQISLDGIKEDHNKTRIRVDKKGSFDQIWKNLINLRNTNLDFEIILRIHVHIDNIKNIKLLLDDLINNFSYDNRFKILIKGIFGWQGASRDVYRLVAKKSFFQEIESLKLYLQDKIQLAYKDKANSMCYAAMANSLVIRADGSIAKCTVALDNPKNNIGKINPDGSLSINNNLYNKWTESLINDDLKGMQCPMYVINQ